MAEQRQRAERVAARAWCGVDSRASGLEQCRAMLSRMRSETAAPGSPWLVAALVLSAMWWMLDLAALRHGVPHPADDHWEDHLIAGHLLGGDGFRTHLIYPPLWGLRDRRTLTVPALVHGPVLPLLTAPALRVLGPARLDSVAPAAALFALLALIPIFRLGTRHFGAPVGAAAAGLFTFAPATLEAVHHSGSVVVGAALIAWTLDLLARARPRGLAAGLLAGAAYLVRPEVLVALPVLLWLAWRRRSSTWPARGAVSRPSDPALLLLVGFVVVALPWWVHHARAVGSPFFNLTSYTLIGFWKGRPDVSVMQDFSLTPARWPAVLRAELPGLLPKWIAFFPHAAKNALCSPSTATGWLALVGLGAAWAGGPRGETASDPRTPRFAACALLLALIPVAAMTLTWHQRLYLVPFYSLFAIGAAAGMSVVARALPAWAQRPRAWIGLLALLLLPSSLPAFKRAGDEAHALARRLVAEREALARDVPGAGPAIAANARLPGRGRWKPAKGWPRLMFSDTPDFVAWTTGRPTLWVTREEFERLYPRRGSGDAPRYELPPRAQVAGFFHDDFRNPSSVGTLVRPAGEDRGR